MRRPFVAGNWKLHRGPGQARPLAKALRTQLMDVEHVDLAVFPPDLSIAEVVAVLADTTLQVGVQQVTAQVEGAYTARTSAAHARAAGCGRALVGHSEVRRDLGVTDAHVHAATRAALSHGLLPVICLGETLEERDADLVTEVLLRQLTGALGDLHPDEVATCTLAYEPVWAIGTGRTASPEQAQAAHEVLRQALTERYPAFVADQTRILYGGSVKPNNAAALMAMPDVDGALVGGASLDPDAFSAIVAAC